MKIEEARIEDAKEIMGWFPDKESVTRWGSPYSINAMLEHAVMHPIRHRFQLENLLREQRG